MIDLALRYVPLSGMPVIASLVLAFPIGPFPLVDEVEDLLLDFFPFPFFPEGDGEVGKLDNGEKGACR